MNPDSRTLLSSNRVYLPPLSVSFGAKLRDTLAANDCDGLFVVDTLATNDWPELIVGNASIVVPSNGQKSEAYIPAAFACDEKAGFCVHGRC